MVFAEVFSADCVKACSQSLEAAGRAMSSCLWKAPRLSGAADKALQQTVVDLLPRSVLNLAERGVVIAARQPRSDEHYWALPVKDQRSRGPLN